MQYGAVGLTAFTLATILSIRPIRKMFFELFLVGHIVLIAYVLHKSTYMHHVLIQFLPLVFSSCLGTCMLVTQGTLHRSPTYGQLIEST